MPNSTPTDATENTPPSVLQADEATGRLSQPASPTAAPDQLTQTSDMSLPKQEEQELSLPQSLKGNEAHFEAFKKLAQELHLPTQTAQKLVEWEASVNQTARQTSEQQREEILQKWTAQTKEQFGPSYQQEITRALQAAERFGGPQLRELLDATGLGSHPVVVKTFHAISQQISEDVSVSGKLSHTTDKTFTEALYGKAF